MEKEITLTIVEASILIGTLKYIEEIRELTTTEKSLIKKLEKNFDVVQA